jgi:hypothetical protein
MILWITVRVSKHRYLSFGTIGSLWPGSMLLAFATLGIAAGSAEENSSPTAVLRSPSSDTALVDEMASFKPLVDQIKVAFEEGQIIVAKTKVGELESLWERAEPRLYLTYPKQSQMLDQSLDRVIALFSQSNPDSGQASASLHQLIAILSHPIHQTVELQKKIPAVDWQTNHWYAPPRSPAFNDLFGS